MVVRRFGDNRSRSVLWWAGIAGLVVVAVGLGSVAWADGDWPWRVLKRSMGAGREVPHEGYRDVVVFRHGEKVRGFRQKVSRDGGGRERVEVLEPPDRRGRLEVCDGKTRWEYYPQANKVIISHVRPARPGMGEDSPGQHGPPPQRLQASYLGDAHVASRTTHIIELSGPAGHPVRKLWVDREKFVQLKMQRFDLRGNVIYSAYFTTINYRPRFAPGLFVFTPPPNCRIVRMPDELPRMTLDEAQRQVGFKAKLPGYLPEGFELERSRVAVPRMKKHLVLWLPFSNGVDRFSLFQGPRALQIRHGQSERGEWWVAGEFCFVLTGSLPAEEVRKIKASMQK